MSGYPVSIRTKSKGAMRMKLMHQLDPYVIHKLNKMCGPSPPPPKEPTAKRAAGSSLSRKDLRELMGTNRQTYKRVGGRIRGK